MSIFRLSPIECTRQQHPYILRLYGTDAQPHSSRLALTDRHTNFNFKKAVAVYSLLSTLLGPMWRLSPFRPHVCECVTHTRRPCSCRTSLGA